MNEWIINNINAWVYDIPIEREIQDFEAQWKWYPFHTDGRELEIQKRFLNWYGIDKFTDYYQRKKYD